MPDVAMCQNKNCPSSDKCHRFLVIPNEFYQAYVEFTPEDGEERCIYFIDYNKVNKNSSRVNNR